MRQVSERHDEYSEEVRNILYRKPSRVVRWGIPVVICIFAGLLLVAKNVPYQEKAGFPVSQTDSACFAVVPPALASIVNQMDSVTVLERQAGKDPLFFSTKITRKETRPGSDNILIYFDLGGYMKKNRPSSGGTGEFQVQLIIYQSNILSEIFKPITALFRQKR